MIDFATYDDLKMIGRKLDEAAILKSATTSKYGKNTFLSYSSKDFELLPAVIKILENHGASVYVDVGDSRLPEKPSPKTAQVLRDAIKEAKKFVLFVTPNSKDSNWIPWELGLSDGAKSLWNVSLFPATEYKHDEQWANQEYLGLYKRIIWGNFKGKDPEWLVYDHINNTAVKLGDWLHDR